MAPDGKDFFSLIFYLTIHCVITGVILKWLPVLSTEPVLRKAAVDRGLRVSTEQCGCRQRNDFVKCAEKVLFYCMFLHFLGSNRS